MFDTRCLLCIPNPAKHRTSITNNRNVHEIQVKIEFTEQACANAAPTRKRAAMFAGRTLDIPKPGLIMSKHLTAASTTDSVSKPLKFVTRSSISLK